MVKRDYGSGGISQKGSGYLAQLRLPNGRRLSHRCATKREARDWLLQQQRDAADGLQPNERQTVGQFLQAWLDDVIQPNREYATWRVHESNVRIHLTPALGRVALRDLTGQAIQRLMNRIGTERSPRTVESVFATLRAALNKAEAWRAIGRSPAKGITLPAKDTAPVAPLSVPEARHLLAAIRQHRLSALFELALWTGMRQGELLGLRWEDVDLEHATLRLDRQLQRQSGQYVYKQPKQHSRRSIDLTRQAVMALQAHRTRQQAERTAATDWTDPALVFTTASGAPLNGTAVTHTFQRVLKRAGLARISFHQLRHAGASLMLASGSSLEMVSKTLGHRDGGVTSRTYHHLTAEGRQGVAERLDKAFEEGSR
jgi:integrase